MPILYKDTLILPTKVNTLKLGREALYGHPYLRALYGHPYLRALYGHPPGASRAVQMAFQWLSRISLAGCPISPFLLPWCLPGCPSCLPAASLVPPRLSNWFFPASLVPPRLSNWSFPASVVPPLVPRRLSN